MWVGLDVKVWLLFVIGLCLAQAWIARHGKAWMMGFLPLLYIGVYGKIFRFLLLRDWRTPRPGFNVYGFLGMASPVLYLVLAYVAAHYFWKWRALQPCRRQEALEGKARAG